MRHDRYGLELSTDSDEAAAAYQDGVDALLASQAGADDAFSRAVAADPGFALPHLGLSRVHATAGRMGDAQGAVAQAAIAADAGGADEREREAVFIEQHLVSGQGADALDRIKAHVARYPLDAMVLAPASSVFGLIGFSGRIDREAEQLAFLEPLADHYGDDWWFQAVLGFALVETGRWAEGRELVERSLALKLDSAHAAHILAHALYEAGEDDTAVAFLDRWLPDLDPRASLHNHLWWHYCLLMLNAGETERLWAAYDRHGAPDASIGPPLNVLSDGASLHWRAHLAGLDDVEQGPARWQALGDYYRDRFSATPGVFLDAHAGLALVAAGDDDGVDEYLAQVEELAAAGKLPAGEMAAVLTRAFHAYAQQRWTDVIEILEPELHRVVCIGGSRAQRDLGLNTVLAAYLRAERWDEAEALLETVEDRQPTHPVGQRRPATVAEPA